MTRVFSLLTGLALLGQANQTNAQTAASKSKGLEQLFSTIDRSAVMSDGTSSAGRDRRPGTSFVRRDRRPGTSSVERDRRPGTSEMTGEERQVLLRSSCEKIMKERLRLTFQNDRNGKMRLQLRGIYTQGPALYFLLRMNNRSALDYEVETIRFFIGDPQNRKRPMISYGEVLPVYLYDSSSIVRGYSQATNVIVLPRFTLPHGKRLSIEVMEKNGGRRLQVQATNFTLERARIL